MKIEVLFILPNLSAGGAERVITTLLQYIDRSKYALTIGVIDLQNAFYINDIPADVKIIDIQARRIRFAFLPISLLIWRTRPHIVFTTIGSLNIAIGILRPILPARTVFIARETTIVSENARRYRSGGLILRLHGFACRSFDAIIAQSTTMRSDLCCSLNLPSEKVFIIHNPYNLKEIERKKIEKVDDISIWHDRGSDEIIRILAVGRLSEEKGYRALIEGVAISGLRQLRLAIIGDGPQRAELEVLVASLGVASQVQFVGLRENPYAYMAQADVFVLSSRFEGFPNVVLEALACGTPVVATPARGGLSDIAQVTSGVNILTGFGAADIAAALRRFARPRSETAFDTTLSIFTPEHIVAKYDALFQQALARQASQTSATNLR